MMNLMKNKIFSVLVGLLAVFLGACSEAVPCPEPHHQSRILIDAVD